MPDLQHSSVGIVGEGGGGSIDIVLADGDCAHHNCRWCSLLTPLAGEPGSVREELVSGVEA